MYLPRFLKVKDLVTYKVNNNFVSITNLSRYIFNNSIFLSWYIYFFTMKILGFTDWSIKEVS
jgi:hypothetical protein